VYRVVDEGLASEITNFGFSERLMMAIDDGKYYLIKQNRPPRIRESFS
jgi:hypothetical protein